MKLWVVLRIWALRLTKKKERQAEEGYRQDIETTTSIEIMQNKRIRTSTKLRVSRTSIRPIICSRNHINIHYSICNTVWVYIGLYLNLNASLFTQLSFCDLMPAKADKWNMCLGPTFICDYTELFAEKNLRRILVVFFFSLSSPILFIYF